MNEPDLIRIDDTVAIPRGELTYRASRSGGPGGQHVNTSSTQVELTWDVGESPSLSSAERNRVQEKLSNRIDSRGVLHLTASGSRSQARNKEEVTERFRHIVANALRVPKRRKKTRPSRRAREKRLRDKRHRSEKKKLRGRVDRP